MASNNNNNKKRKLQEEQDLRKVQELAKVRNKGIRVQCITVRGPWTYTRGGVEHAECEVECSSCTTRREITLAEKGREFKSTGYGKWEITIRYEYTDSYDRPAEPICNGCGGILTQYIEPN